MVIIVMFLVVLLSLCALGPRSSLPPGWELLLLLLLLLLRASFPGGTGRGRQEKERSSGGYAEYFIVGKWVKLLTYV